MRQAMPGSEGRPEGLIDPGDLDQVPGDRLLAEKEGIAGSLRQVMVADVNFTENKRAALSRAKKKPAQRNRCTPGRLSLAF